MDAPTKALATLQSAVAEMRVQMTSCDKMMDTYSGRMDDVEKRMAQVVTSCDTVLALTLSDWKA